MKRKIKIGIIEIEIIIKKMNDFRKWLIAFFFLASACVNLNVYEKNEAIIGAKWPNNKIFRFEYISNDTLSTKNVEINLRHNDFYKYSNIYLFVTTIAPDGKSLKDTVEFTLANAEGKWAGSGIGNVYDLRMFYRHNIRFGQEGKYIFYIQHGMRETELDDITDIGIRIENAK
jgi:gliding motility-associated lipoprotein GldH